jgi:CheY-like chemotaxis protein
MFQLDLVNKLKINNVTGKPVILCVDDELIILSSLSQQLMRKYGQEFSIQAVDTAELALDIVKKCNEDNTDLPVVICDRLMRVRGT